MILYVHPRTDIEYGKTVVPLSIPAIINRIRPLGEVRGFYERELRPEHIRAATIVVMDIHWFLSLKSGIRLSRRIKRINPRCVIVAGGLTASLFPEQLLRDSAIDYILRGDGLIPLEKLVRAVLNHESIDEVPNLVSRDGETKTWYALSSQDLNGANFRDISWFPSLDRDTRRLQRWSNGMAYPIHPIPLLYQGCPFDCTKHCYASDTIQRRLFRRGLVVRGAEHVREDFVAFDEDPDIRALRFVNDFFILPPEYASQVLDRHYDLYVQYKLYSLPRIDDVARIVDSFLGGDLLFLDDWKDAEKVVPFLDSVMMAKNSGRFRIWILYYKYLRDSNPDYAATLRHVAEQTGCSIREMDPWWDYALTVGEDGRGLDEEYQQSLTQSRRYWLYNRLLGATMVTRGFAPRFTAAAIRQARRIRASIIG